MTTFSKELLYQLRNEIDINWLMTNQLNLQRRFDKIWRFQCPLCGQFNTATQSKTNLARCFNCQKNFNTIDLVIHSKKLNFAPSVQFLIACWPKTLPASQQLKLKPELKNRANKESALKALKKMKQMLR